MTYREDPKQRARTPASAAARARRAAGIATLAAFLVVSGVSALAFKSITGLVRGLERVDRSHAMIEALDRLLLSLDDTETGQRGFIITGDSAFLDPHILGVVRAREMLARLRVLAAGDSAQNASLDQLAEVANDRIVQSQQGVAAMVRDGPAAARAIVVAGEGRRYMEAARTLVGRMQAQEHRRLEARRASAWRSLVQAALVSGLGILTAGLLAVVAVLLIRRTLVATEQGRRSATYARTLIDAASDGIYGVDARGNLTFANAAMANALGYGVSELIGRHGHTLFHHSRADGRPYPVEECSISAALSADPVGKIDDEVIWRRDGTCIPVEYSVAKVNDPEGRAGAVISFRDITHRQVVHNALKAAMEAAEASNKAKSDFLARMSHELRTPLNSVIGFANILLRNKTGSMTEKELAYLGRIQKNGVSLLSLINDILDLSKIEAGKMEVEFAQADLGEIIRDTALQFEPQVIGRDLKLELTVPEDLPPIRTDDGRLRQVIANLLSNALKFTECGIVSITVRKNPVTGEASAIEVSDSGIGIPQERIGAIFDAFEQAERSITRRFGGTGLGLPISRSLCVLLGYELRVTSTEGEGSTFTIDLEPRLPARPPQPVADSPADVDSPLRGKIVLVIDDSADDRLLIANQVAELGGTPVEAASGTEGIEIARRDKPDLITLDLLMPAMDGAEVLRILKKDAELCHTPVIVVTAVADGHRGLMGALSLLPKPLTSDDLRRAYGRTARLGRVLIVEDDLDTQALLSSYAYDEGASEVAIAGDGAVALSMLEQFEPDLILLDLVLPTYEGAELLAWLAENNERDVAVLIVTGKELSVGETRTLRVASMGVLRKGERLEAELRKALRNFVAVRRADMAAS